MLVDGDFLLHRASCSVMVNTDISDCKREQSVNPDEGLDYITRIIDRISSLLDADDIAIYLSCGRSTSFRRKLAPFYKSNRDSSLRHLGIKTIKGLLRSKYNVFEHQFLEADDLIGIEATTQEDGVEKIVVGNDKDFKSIPCNYLCYMHMEDGVITTSVEEADRNHLIQTLMGDASDGYKGCPKIGKVKAEFIVDNGWSAVVKAYEDAGMDSNDALLNARLAWILRNGDLNDNGKVNLWKPKNI